MKVLLCAFGIEREFKISQQRYGKHDDDNRPVGLVKCIGSLV